MTEKKKLVACKFRASQDKANWKQKVVYMLSTLHNSAMIDTGKADKDGNRIIKPAIIKAYNQHMGGVDRVDQQLHNVQALRKTYKWCKKLIFRLILQSALNAQKIYAEFTGNDKLYYIDYLMQCINLMVTDQRGQPQQMNDDVSRLTGRHFPALVPIGAGGKEHRSKKRCCVCYARKLTTNKGGPLTTIYVCGECLSASGLHPDKCFKIYHTELDVSK